MAAEAPREAVWPEGAGAEAGFVRAVLSLLEKPDTTVRFFERGDYYSVHGADARLAARELFRTRAVIRQLAGAPGACGAGRWAARGARRQGRSGVVLRVADPGGLFQPLCFCTARLRVVHWVALITFACANRLFVGD